MPEVSLPEGIVVGALAVVNAAGLPVFPGAQATAVAEEAGAAAKVRPAGPGGPGGGGGGGGLNTTLVVVGTNAALTPSECKRLATASHAGLARALDPSHTLVDGDTAFAVSTGGIEFDRTTEQARVVALMSVQIAAAEATRDAILDGVLAATPVTTPSGSWDPYPAP
jgi:L-aminopeptidase/D-esterase-like protein